MIQQAKIQIDRYRRLTLPMSGRMDHVVGEHQKIVKALEAGRADQAVEAMHEHLDLVLPAVEIARSLRPDYFIHHFPESGQDTTH